MCVVYINIWTHVRIQIRSGRIKTGQVMMTSSNGNIFRVTGDLCGKFTGPRPVTRSFDVFFDLRLNKRLSKQPWGWWFETPAWSLWRHRNVEGYWFHVYHMLFAIWNGTSCKSTLHTLGWNAYDYIAHRVMLCNHCYTPEGGIHINAKLTDCSKCMYR